MDAQGYLSKQHSITTPATIPIQTWKSVQCFEKGQGGLVGGGDGLTSRCRRGNIPRCSRGVPSGTCRRTSGRSGTGWMPPEGSRSRSGKRAPGEAASQTQLSPLELGPEYSCTTRQHDGRSGGFGGLGGLGCTYHRMSFSIAVNYSFAPFNSSFLPIPSRSCMSLPMYFGQVKTAPGGFSGALPVDESTQVWPSHPACRTYEDAAGPMLMLLRGHQQLRRPHPWFW